MLLVALFASWLAFDRVSRDLRVVPSLGHRPQPLLEAAERRMSGLKAQSRDMIQRSADLGRVFEPSRFPPGYALILHAARRTGVPLGTVNYVLLIATLGTMLLALRSAGHGPLFVPVAVFYLICAFTYFNLAQFTAEALIVPLSVVALLLLRRNLLRPRAFTLLGLSLVCGAIFFCRWHAIAWLAPLVFVHLLGARRPAGRMTRAVRAGVFVVVALTPIVAYGVRNRIELGHFTGLNRTEYAPRNLGPDTDWYSDHTGLVDNLGFLFKTYFLDFLSPVDIATHSATRLPPTSVVGWGIAALFAAYAALRIARSAPAWRDLGVAAGRSGLVDRWRSPSPVLLLTESVVVYVGVTIVLWTISNNDPLYTRFLFPTYAFLILLGGIASGRAVAGGSAGGRGWERGLLLAAVLSVFAANLWKTITILPELGSIW